MSLFEGFYQLRCQKSPTVRCLGWSARKASQNVSKTERRRREKKIVNRKFQLCVNVQSNILQIDDYISKGGKRSKGGRMRCDWAHLFRILFDVEAILRLYQQDASQHTVLSWLWHTRFSFFPTQMTRNYQIRHIFRTIMLQWFHGMVTYEDYWLSFNTLISL